MFRRLFWLVLGAGLTLWAQWRLWRQVRRYAPDRVVRQVSASVRTLGDDLREAARYGQAAMREREASLRAQFHPPAR